MDGGWQRSGEGGNSNNLNASLPFPDWSAAASRSNETQPRLSHLPLPPPVPSQSLPSTHFHFPDLHLHLSPRQPGLQEASLAIPAQVPYAGAEEQVPGLQGNEAPNRTAPRRRRKDQPSESEWQRHKPFLKKAYMDDDKTLDEVMAIMEQKSFRASRKLYKQKFSEWDWHKKMPRSLAKKFIQKAELRAPSQTEFVWGGRAWSFDRVKDTYERGVGTPQDIPTPLDIDMRTPKTPGVVSQTAPSPAPVDDDAWVPTNVQTGQPWVPRSSDYNHYEFQWRNMSLDEVRSLFSEATHLLREGDLLEAEHRLQKALAGFSRLLPFTHEETLRAAYRLAAFFARASRMSDANDVLNWMSNNYLKKFGARDVRTMKHYLRVVELLQSWSWEVEAEVLIHRIIDSLMPPSTVDHPAGIRLTDSTIHQTTLKSLADEQLSALFPETEDSRAIDAQLQMVDLFFSARSEGLEELLPRLIAHCKRRPEKLVLQGIRAECSLARLKIDKKKNEEADALLDDAKASLWKLLAEGPPPPPPPEAVKACRWIAFLYHDNNQKPACNSTLEAAVAKLSLRLHRSDKIYCRVVYEFILQVARRFQSLCAHEDATYWLQRLLGLTILTLGPEDPLTKKAERLLCGGDKSYPLDSVDKFMEAGLTVGLDDDVED